MHFCAHISIYVIKLKQQKLKNIIRLQQTIGESSLCKKRSHGIKLPLNQAHLSPTAASVSEFLPLDFGKEEAQKLVLKQLKKKRQESSDSLAETFQGFTLKYQA